MSLIIPYTEEGIIHMDPTVQQEPIVSKTGTQNFNILSILLPLFTLLVGLGLGLLTSRIIFPVSPQPTPKPTIAPQVAKPILPISSSLLQNPIVYEWRGSVKGKMITKDEHAFVLQDDKGNKINITDLRPNKIDRFNTLFYKKSDSKLVKITLRDIPVGAELGGDFFIFKNGPNTPVGSSFIVE